MCWDDKVAVINPQIEQLIIVHGFLVTKYELEIDKLIDHWFDKKIRVVLGYVKLLAQAINIKA